MNWDINESRTLYALAESIGRDAYPKRGSLDEGPRMKRLDLAFVVMGFSCTVAQVLLAREFMVLFTGNELILGVLLANWLFCVAIGSWGLGRLADRFEEATGWFVVTLIIISVLLPSQILLVRSMGAWLVAERGEMPGLFSTFYSTFLVLLPFCSLHGLQFTLGSRLYANGDDPEAKTRTAKGYVYEALGSVLGGLAFTYILVHNLQVIEISLGLGLLNLSMALILSRAWKVKIQPTAMPGILSGIVLLLIMLGGLTVITGRAGALDASSYRWRWGALGLIHSENSIYGNIAVTLNDGQLGFWVNGLPHFTSPITDVQFVEEVVHFPMLSHPSPRRVLLIGGGLGGVVKELQKHPVYWITYVELDPRLIEVTRRYSPEASAVLEDPRVEVAYMDGRLFVKGASSSYDVVILNLPPPSTLQLNRFYTLEFFGEIEGLLANGGILSVWLPSSLGHISEEMGDRNRCIYETLRAVFPSCLVVPGDYNIFMASSGEEENQLTCDVKTLCERLRERGMETSAFSEEYIRYKLSPERVEMGLAYLEHDDMEANRDMRPVAVYHDLALWNAMFHQRTRWVFAFFSAVDPRWIALSLGLITVALLLVRRRIMPRQTPIILAVFTTGFAGMTLSTVALYAYQALCGYLYQELGVVTASFMLGAALGGWLMVRRIAKNGWDNSIIYKMESAMIVFSLAAPMAIWFLSKWSFDTNAIPVIRTVLPLLNCTAGFLVGMEFPLATSISFEDGGQVSGVLGQIYASDLLGACMGAILASIWLIPLHGIVGSSLVAVLLNAVSLTILYSTLESC